MSDDSKLDNMAPLGKSVEEVEEDSGNRVNPPAPENGGTGTVPALPIANTSAGGLGGLSGTFASGFTPISGVTTDPADPEENGGERRMDDDPTESPEA